MNKASKVWKRLLARGVKKDVFLRLLKERFPKGEFTFGDARRAYDDAHRILHGPNSKIPTGAVGPRDVLTDVGAIFEFSTGRGGPADAGWRDWNSGWPSTRAEGRVWLPGSRAYREALQRMILGSIESLRQAAAKYGNTKYIEDRIEELNREAAGLSQ